MHGQDQGSNPTIEQRAGVRECCVHAIRHERASERTKERSTTATVTYGRTTTAAAAVTATKYTRLNWFTNTQDGESMTNLVEQRPSKWRLFLLADKPTINRYGRPTWPWTIKTILCQRPFGGGPLRKEPRVRTASSAVALNMTPNNDFC